MFVYFKLAFGVHLICENISGAKYFNYPVASVIRAPVSANMRVEEIILPPVFPNAVLVMVMAVKNQFQILLLTE